MSDPKDFDAFWLSEGQKIVSNTFTNLGRRLNNYTTYLNYLSGFYTSTGLVLITFSEPQSLITYVLIIAPIIILYITHYVIVTEETIPLNYIDIRSPLQINQIYNNLTSRYKKEVESAKKWVSFATFCVIVGGTVAIYQINIEKKENAIIEVNTNLIDEYTSQRKLHFFTSKDKITIEAKLPDIKSFEIKYILNKTTIKDTIHIPKLTDYKMVLPINTLIDINEINTN